MNEINESMKRILSPLEEVEFSDQKATSKEISLIETGKISVWGVLPGQEVEAHKHPNGQDTWVILQGNLTYYLQMGNGGKKTQKVSAGQVCIAPPDTIHGCLNESEEKAAFLSITSQKNVGFEKLQDR